MRKVAGSAVRWVGKSETVLARRAKGRVGVEPRDLSAPPVGSAASALAPPVDPCARSPSQPAAARGKSPLLQLPPALPISCHEHDGGMLVSEAPSDISDARDDGSRSPSTITGATACQGKEGAMAAVVGTVGDDRDARLDRRAEGAGERVEAEAKTAAKPSVTDTSAERGDQNCVRSGGSDIELRKGGAGEAKTTTERAPSPATARSNLSRRLSATFPGTFRRAFPDDDDGTAGTGGGGGGGKSSRSEELLAANVTEAFSRSSSPTSRLVSSTLRRRLSSARAVSTLNKAAAADVGAATYSPTQAVLNITWALRRLRPLGTPRERRMAFKGLRESSPVGIPQMFLLAFVDLAALGEIPRRTGDRFLGKADKRPVTVCELMARAGESGEDPVVVYVSHRWLEPDFKNPDDHSKARFYQVRDGGRDREWFSSIRFGSMLVGYYCCLCVCLCATVVSFGLSFEYVVIGWV